MAFGRKSTASNSEYEVRCPRCDVSFPPEARTCMHCGGPTGSAGVFAAFQSVETVVHDEYSPVVGMDQTPIEATSESPFSMGTTDPFADDDRDDVQESSGSIGQSIFKSLGGVVWVILLIGFSLARSCGEG